MRTSAKFLIVAAMLAGCHLIGGTDGLVIIEGDDPSTVVATSGAGATAASASSSGGGPTQCSDDLCAQNATECQTCTCLEGVVCDCTPLPFGQMCSIGYCDSDGSCVECLNDDDYPCMNTSLNCEQKTCVAASCNDLEKNGDETGLDCGGSCAPCPNGQGCADSADCTSALCSQLVCAPCNMHSECGTDRYCENNTCFPRKDLFAPCTAGYQCLTNVCVCTIIGCGCGW